MTIEFNCPNCDKLLRTKDNKAGSRANCPGCGDPISVPSDGDASFDEFDEFEDDYGDEDGGFGEMAVSPPRRSGGTKACPMCGESIKAAANKCRYCGESFTSSKAAPSRGRRRRGRRGSGRPTKIDVGDVISTSWEIFQSQMGLLIGGTIVFMAITTAISFVMQLLQGEMFAALGPNRGALAIAVLITLLINLLINSYFQAGWTLFFVKVARGKNPDIGDLFAGGPYYMRLLGNNLLLAFASLGMYIACIVPALFLGILGLLIAVPLVLTGMIIGLLIYWPFQYVIVDENAPHQNALSRAKELTSGNWGAVFVLFLASFGINILGALACLIGLLFTIPLTVLMMAVAYCQMAGRSVGSRR